MKTGYSEIVNENYIGKSENPISMNEILKKANDEQLQPSSSSLEKVLFLGIDVQQDFMDNLFSCFFSFLFLLVYFSTTIQLEI